MKNFKFLIFLTLSTSLIFANLEVGGLVEITSYLNARSSKNFYKLTPNVVKTLSPGTKGEIEVVSKLPSGNYGLKVKFKNANNEEKSYWVYYNKKNPRLKLIDQKKEETTKLEEAEVVTPKEKVPALEDTADQRTQDKIAQAPVIDAVTSSKEVVAEVNETLEAQRKAECERIIHDQEEKERFEKEIQEEAKKIEVSKNTSTQETPDIKLHKIENDVAPSSVPYNDPLWFSMTKLDENGIYLNYSRDNNNQDTLNGFTITNDGGNEMVQKPGARRDFEFNFPGLSSSDLSLMVVDIQNPNATTDSFNLMMFFPRKQVPSVKTTATEYIVKLPTGEEVIFDRKTKTIKSGALSEKPINKSGLFACHEKVKYEGSGVVLKISAHGKLPHDTHPESNPNGIVTISKKDQKNCRVPVKELFYHDKAKRGQNFFKKEYATDEGFNKFLTKRCGFSID